MKYGNQIRREIGRQLGTLRRYKQLSLHQVSQQTNIPLNTIDEIEIGIVRPWYIYHRLKTYYNCDIKLIEK